MSAGVSRSFFTAASSWAQAKAVPPKPAEPVSTEDLRAVCARLRMANAAMERLNASPSFIARLREEATASTPPWWERLFGAPDGVSR